MISTGLKHHKSMRKQRFQHLRALFIHFMQFCGPWITHKNDIPIHLDQVLKWQKILVTSIFYHFLFAVSLGSKASKMSEKFRLDRKIGFQNMFFTKCINVIIDIGPSIILRSIYTMHNKFSNCFVWVSPSTSDLEFHLLSRRYKRQSSDKNFHLKKYRITKCDDRAKVTLDFKTSG